MKWVAYLFMALYFIPASAQFTSFDVVRVHAGNLSSDELGNLYIFTRSEINKYDAAGNMLQRYSDKRTGDISFMDAGNPFKLIVFYREQGLIRILDNMLAPAGDIIRLRDHGIYQPWLVTSSYNNHFWVFDKTNSTLLRFTLEMEENLRIDNLQLVTGREIQPEAMDENGNWLFIKDASGDILLFDIFGNYIKTIHSPGLVSFQPDEDLVYLISDSLVTKHNLKRLTESPVFPITRKGQVRIGKNNLYFLSSDSLYIYR